MRTITKREVSRKLHSKLGVVWSLFLSIFKEKLKVCGRYPSTRVNYFPPVFCFANLGLLQIPSLSKILLEKSKFLFEFVRSRSQCIHSFPN